MTREQQALVELGRTSYSPGVRTTLIVVFAVTLLAVPLWEAIGNARVNIPVRQGWQQPGGPESSVAGRQPGSLTTIRLFPRWPSFVAVRSWTRRYMHIPRPAALRAYENDLVIRSAAGK